MTKFYSPSTKGFYCADVHAVDQVPTDALEVSDDDYHALFLAQSTGKVIQPGVGGAPIALHPSGPTPAQHASRLGLAVKTYIDAAAKALGYDSILSAVSYADDDTVPAFQVQGQALRAWRANVWKDATPIMNAVIAGTASPVPTAAELIASLPVFVAPAA